MLTALAAASIDTVPPVAVIPTAFAAAVAPTVTVFAPVEITVAAAVFIVIVPVKLASLAAIVPPVTFKFTVWAAAEPVRVRAASAKPFTDTSAAHCDAVKAMEGVPVAKEASIALTFPFESIVKVLLFASCPIILLTVAFAAIL